MQWPVPVYSVDYFELRNLADGVNVPIGNSNESFGKSLVDKLNKHSEFAGLFYSTDTSLYLLANLKLFAFLSDLVGVTLHPNLKIDGSNIFSPYTLSF